MIDVDQSAWLVPYTDFNTQLRTKAMNNFEKDFFKLMNNSVFGKAMENIRKHKDISLVMNQEVYLKRVMKPNFKSGIRFRENLIGCQMGKIRVPMNKPIYLKQAILDLTCTNFIMTTCSPSMERIFGCVIWILTPLFTTIRPTISTRTLPTMLRLFWTQVATAAAILFQ